MFGIKMPWTKRREAREKQEAEAIARTQARRQEIRVREEGRRKVQAQSVKAGQVAESPAWPGRVAPSGSAATSALEPVRSHGGTFDGGGASGDWSSPSSSSCDSGSSSSDSSSSSSDSYSCSSGY